MKRELGRTGIAIAPLVFGGNVFAWTVDEPTCFALLDRFFDAGLNAIRAEVALAWLMARPGVTAPIASATSLEQLESRIRATRLPLAAVDIALLDSASA